MENNEEITDDINEVIEITEDKPEDIKEETTNPNNMSFEEYTVTYDQEINIDDF